MKMTSLTVTQSLLLQEITTEMPLQLPGQFSKIGYDCVHTVHVSRTISTASPPLPPFLDSGLYLQDLTFINFADDKLEDKESGGGVACVSVFMCTPCRTYMFEPDEQILEIFGGEFRENNSLAS